MTASNNTRLVWLDAVKGYGIFLVLLCHAGGWIPYIGLYMTVFYMPLFFIATGYTFSGSKTWQQDIKNKSKRLLIPYFAYGIPLVVLSCFARMNNGLCKGMLGLAYSRFALYPLGNTDNLIFLQYSNGPLWFLTCLWTSFCLFLPLVKLSRPIATFLALGYVSLNILLLKLPILLPWSLDTAFMGALFIAFGVLLRRFSLVEKGTQPIQECLRDKQCNDSIHKTAHFFLCVGALAAFIFLVRFNGYVNMSVREYGSRGIISFFIFLVIGCLGTWLLMRACLFLDKTPFIKCFAILGRMSLTLMCSHYFIYRLVRKTSSTSNSNIDICIEIGLAILMAIGIEQGKRLWSKLKRHKHHGYL